MSAKPTVRDRVNNADPFAGWPDPIPLRNQLPAVQAFDSALLPGQLRAWVIDIAERMNCPADLVAIPAMVAAGSVVGCKIGIRPQRQTDWLEVCNLWGCVVAPPGSLKSPTAAEALGPIRRLEAEAAEENKTRLAEFKAAESLHKLEKERADKDARSALKSGGRDAALGALLAVEMPEPPAMRRYLTSDATAEKLGEICQDNPQGVMVHRDELLSLLSELDNPDKAMARGFFLSGWGGKDGYTFDRIGRGTVPIRTVNISLFGTTQPTRLAAYVRNNLACFDDGMVQRLQLLAWPDFSRTFREVDRYPNSEAKQAAFACYGELAAIDAHKVHATRDECDGAHGVPYFRFGDAAQDMFSQWRFELEAKLQGDDLAPELVAHFAKYRGLIPRLALICHLANKGSGPVSVEATRQALAWAGYLESHARRVYASLSLDKADAARAIWSRVKKGDLPCPFTARDIERKGWSGLSDSKRIAAGLATLSDADWLACEKVETGGRPSTIYRANPKALKA